MPTLSAFVSIYGLFNDRSTVIDQIALLSGIVPAGGLDLIRDQLTPITTESDGTLGVTLLVSLAIALWSASAGVKAMFEAMNVAYHEEEKRSFIALNGSALIFTIGGAVAALLVVGNRSVTGQLGGTIAFDWSGDGVIVNLTLDAQRLAV